MSPLYVYSAPQCFAIEKPSLGTVQDHNCFKCLYKPRLLHAVCPSFWRAPVHFYTRYIKTYTGYSTLRQVATGVRAMPMKGIKNGLKEHIPLRHRSRWQLGTCLQQPGEILHGSMRTPETASPPLALKQSLPQRCMQYMTSQLKQGPNKF